MADQKLEDIMIDATTNAKDAGGVQFVNWVLRLTNSLGASNPQITELNYLAGSYPGRNLSDEQKWALIEKLRKAGVNV